MKILHFADVHMGTNSWGRNDPKTGQSSRISDAVLCMDKMVESALEHQVDLVLFAGDAYRNSDPSPTLQTYFFKPILHLLAADIPVVMIPGNHDLPGTMVRAHSLELASLFSMPNLYIIDKPTALLRIKSKAGEIGIIGLPWVNRLRLLRDLDLIKNNTTELAGVMAERLSQTAREYLEVAPTDLPLILLAHQAVSGTIRPGSESSMVWGDVPLLPLHLFTHEKLAYSALGHYHCHQDLSPVGPVHAVYAGSLDRLDFSDENVEKGFVIAELEGSYFVPRFYPTPARVFKSIELRFDSSEELDEKIKTIFSPEQITNAVVHLIVDKREQQPTEGDLQKLRRALSPAHNYSLEITRIRSDQITSTASLGLGLSYEKYVDGYLEIHSKELGDNKQEVRFTALEWIHRKEGKEEL